MSVFRVVARRARFPVATAALLAGCTAPPLGPTVQVMPGPGKTFDTFQVDTAACKAFAQQQARGQAEAANQSTVGTAVGPFASPEDQQAIQTQYDNAFSQCMYATGEQVPGYIVPAHVPSRIAAPNPLVRATQRHLIRLGYLRGAADGYVGPKTRRAISSYQQANAMAVDGVASARLLARLQATPSTPVLPPTTASNTWEAPTDLP